MAQKGTMLHHIRDERHKSSEHNRITQRSSTQKNHLIERSCRDLLAFMGIAQETISARSTRNIILGSRETYQTTNERQCMDESCYPECNKSSRQKSSLKLIGRMDWTQYLLQWNLASFQSYFDFNEGK